MSIKKIFYMIVQVEFMIEYLEQHPDERLTYSDIDFLKIERELKSKLDSKLEYIFAQNRL